jgi:hypothetical protein
MKRILIAVLLTASCFSQSVPDAPKPAPCLILAQPHVWGWTYQSTRRMRYVAGDFPASVKWKSNLSDKDVREVQAAGGRIAIIPEKYTAADVETAKTSCGSAPKEKP